MIAKNQVKFANPETGNKPENRIKQKKPGKLGFFLTPFVFKEFY